MASRLLIRNGFVVSLDHQVGSQPESDVLVEDGLIVAIGPGLEVSDAQVIDATGTIVVPGFVDTHRHTWQTSLRGMMPSCSLESYMGTVMFGIGSIVRPEDVYAGNQWGALEALNAGVTTIVDWAHCNNTPEHADAAVDALRTTGIRVMYAYGPPSGPALIEQAGVPHTPDARRLRSRYFSSNDDLMTFALALRGPGLCPPEIVKHDWNYARELDARITMHVGMRIPGLEMSGVIQELDDAGLLGSDTTYVHLNTNSDAELALIADSGGSASIAPYVEMVMGHGHPPIGRLLDHGITPSLSVDVTTTVPGDMFTQMRVALAQNRELAFKDDPREPFSPTLTHEDVLRFATVAGAAACGLDDKIGTLTPGKQADLVLVRADDVNTFPVCDPIGTVVTSADTSNVDTVIVRGEVRKRNGRLVGVDLSGVRPKVQSSRDYIVAACAAAAL
ncbi:MULTISPECIES: amidohydrolase family protein [Mycolicibacterium]|uniref:Cytosine deaminase-like metal-dependent hydrolase n=1 Tax=Mycolicibacterium senegalense TaxID=1796 RepID=A0A378W5W7_9MYCO|nr:MULTISPECIES: amidohydrolase family protein [Mycolicibacterium]MCV7336083.1 amidohydrolase family protein [Mycolicibacterium senegalense]MDR7287911.1 cytosine/adenosine deaminase-related metal-dependent hydrolase [Mycolicibacterium senegalense]QZA24914.1 amidohydrolase family protein [Mycolicibacterium senegalense]CDP86681.1 amidohydrolase [Mycolicibacterium farcinogenes]SUA28513.1 cytosine deaminase-like metal-dependent hydrolase [Mycolicibacterium senegalense]